MEKEEISTLPASPELLEYYRRLCERNESEIGELEAKVTACAPQHEEVHRLQWELRKRNDEVRDLQKALSEAHTALWDEREEVLRVYAENDTLKRQEIEDRRRIQKLLDMQQPVAGGETTYFKRDVAEGDTKRILPLQTHSSKQSQPPCHYVYLPNENTDHLLMEIDSLRLQLAEQEKLAREKNAAMMHDRRIREDEVRTSSEADRNRIIELEGKAARNAELHRDLMKDHLQFRRETQIAQRQLGEELTKLRASSATLFQETVELRTGSEIQARVLVEKMEEDTVRRLDQVRGRLKEREAEMRELKHRWAETELSLRRRIGHLQTNVTRLEQRNGDLERRHAMEREGFQKDLANLRDRLHRLELRLVKRHALHYDEDVDPAELRRALAEVHDSLTSVDTLQDVVRNLEALGNHTHESEESASTSAVDSYM